MASFPVEQDTERLEIVREVGDGFRDWVSVTHSTLDVNRLINFTKSRRAGAVSTFLGTTREFFEDKDVVHLEYEAYTEMALQCMLEICDKVRATWPVLNIVIQHKLGDCPVLDVSVAIIISSEHRKESLAALSFAIDELKLIVPIWKKEHYKDGDANWKSNALQAAEQQQVKSEKEDEGI